MERYVQILSKTMGGDAAGAADALTTGMLQFGVDLSNPKTAAAEMAKMMDVMANSAQAGAAEVPQISAALKVSGVAAKQAKVSFIETNAAIQALAAGGKEGSEAGMALRNVLGKMAGEDVLPKEAVAKLKDLKVNMSIVSDTSLPFTTRLRELKKAQGDATIMAQMFGTENAAAANILLSSVDAQDKLAQQIGKTGGAQAQANIVMESTAEKMARMKAAIDDVKLGFFEATGGVTAYLQPAMEVMTTVNSFAPVFGAAKTAVMALATAKGREALMERISTVASKSEILISIAVSTIVSL
jgi:TP901 family phage tail tape measure protein